VDVLAQKALRAAKQYGCKTIALAGGVAANLVLRARLESDAEANRMTFTVPPFALCTDNAAMIAMAAYFNLRGGAKLARLDKVKADPAWELK
jgi:N6-L-threonylcarbamoyladenine synthase